VISACRRAIGGERHIDRRAWSEVNPRRRRIWYCHRRQHPSAVDRVAAVGFELDDIETGRLSTDEAEELESPPGQGELLPTIGAIPSAPVREEIPSISVERAFEREFVFGFAAVAECPSGEFASRASRLAGISLEGRESVVILWAAPIR